MQLDIYIDTHEKSEQSPCRATGGNKKQNVKSKKQKAKKQKAKKAESKKQKAKKQKAKKAESKKRKAKSRKQKAESRKQKVNKQKSERKKAENKKQKTKSGKQKQTRNKYVSPVTHYTGIQNNDVQSKIHPGGRFFYFKSKKKFTLIYNNVRHLIRGQRLLRLPPGHQAGREETVTRLGV